MSIHFLFNVKGDPDKWNPGAIYYYNGATNQVQGLQNEDELKYITETHKAIYGRDIPSYQWSKKNPVHERIFGILSPGSKENELSRRMREIQEKINEYIEIYGDPKNFTALTNLPIRDKPHRTGEVIALARVNQKFILDKTLTACDLHWGKITFSKQTKTNGDKYNLVDTEGRDVGWIPIGDILGDTYGIWGR